MVCSTTCSSVLLLLTVHHLVYQDGVLLVVPLHTKNMSSFGHVVGVYLLHMLHVLCMVSCTYHRLYRYVGTWYMYM